MQNVDEYILGTQLPLEDLAPRSDFLELLATNFSITCNACTRCGRKLWNLGKTSTPNFILPEAWGKMLLWKIAVFRSAHNPDGSNKLWNHVHVHESDVFVVLEKKNRDREAIHERILDIVSDLLLLNIKTPLEESFSQLMNLY